MTSKILQIIPTLVRGGAEKQLTLLATGMNRDRFETHVCLLTDSGPYRETLEEVGIPIHEIGKRRKLDFAAYYRLKKLIRKIQPDLVHTWIFAANSYGRYAALNAGVKKIIAGERSVDPWKRWHELAIDRYLAKRTSGLVTNSRGVVEYYATHGIDADRFTVIPNGIDLPDQQPVEEMRQVLLQALGLPEQTKLVGSVGRLWPQKRIKDLIWAADLIKCSRDDVHVLIIGDGPLRSNLENFQRQVKIEDRVHFLGERPDAREIISCLDCFWLASDYEGQSNAVMEAMAAGVPVVASDIPGNRDLVVDGSTGFLFETGDRAGLAQKTESILNDASIAGKLGENAVERMKSEFTTSRMVAAYEVYYSGLLEE
ncbi:MAG: glycosyltransferase [Planctomycetota bacterium]|nr:glycosyltransferase [Planctomycetota bacterium]